MFKKVLMSLLLVLTLTALPARAEEKLSPAATAPVVEVYQNQPTAGQVTLVQDDQTVVISAEDYQAEVDRGLTDAKIIKNEKIHAADSDGVGVTLMAMCIVLIALVILSLLFLFFGKLFARTHAKKKAVAHGIEPEVVLNDEDHDSGEVIAAIAMALDEHFNARHDLEDTVLTIRRIKRAYSPWSSKIYGMRHDLPVHHNL